MRCAADWPPPAAPSRGRVGRPQRSPWPRPTAICSDVAWEVLDVTDGDAVRRLPRGFRPPRRPRQSRRNRSGSRRVRGGRIHPYGGRQPLRNHACLLRGASAAGRAGRRDRQCCVDDELLRVGQRACLCGQQGGRRSVHEEPGDRLGRRRHSGECGRPGMDRHADDHRHIRRLAGAARRSSPAPRSVAGVVRTMSPRGSSFWPLPAVRS